MGNVQHKRRAFNEPGHAHALTFCCYRRYPFLRAERACHWLAEAIETARTVLDLDLWAYVFMPEHVHLVVHPRRPVYEVSAILRAVKGPVGRHATAFLSENAPE